MSVNCEIPSNLFFRKGETLKSNHTHKLQEESKFTITLSVLCKFEFLHQTDNSSLAKRARNAREYLENARNFTEPI